MNIKDFLVIVILPSLISCASLREVNQYATVSSASLNNINEVDYTFNDYCLHACELQQLRSGEIDTLFHCDCEETAAKADEAIRKIHSAITSYLVAIGQLSDNKSFSIDAANLTGALLQNSFLKLTDRQVETYTKAGNFIATSATALYRKGKLKEYIEKADPIFQDLTETFIFLINNRLREQLKTDYDTRLANIKQMLDNAENDKGFKQIVIKLFLDEQAYYKKHNALLDSYAALLRSVKKGHHDLYLQRNNLKDMATRALIKNYAKDVQDIVAGIEK